MSGHSKWANIKIKKGKTDALRGKIFTKIGREIAIAVREGGSNPDSNSKLRDVIAKAKSNNMPNDNIQRSIKKAAGELGNVDYEEITYEGYAPGGVAVLVECLTDNKNRAVSEVRLAFNRNGGNMADSGSVAYLFERKGVVTVTKGEHSEDDLLEVVLDAGAEEINDEGEAFEILSEATDVVAVRTALQEAGVDYDSAEAQFVPTMRTPVDLDGAHKALRLIEALEDSDDVQNVYSNLDIPDDVAAQLADADEE